MSRSSSLGPLRGRLRLLGLFALCSACTPLAASAPDAGASSDARADQTEAGGAGGAVDAAPGSGGSHGGTSGVDAATDLGATGGSSGVDAAVDRPPGTGGGTAGGPAAEGGRQGGQGGGQTGGALPSRDAGDDAPPPACDPSKPFGAPSVVAGLPTDTRATIIARFSPDELTAYLSRADPGQTCCNYQILVATRPSLSDAFGTAVALDAVNSPSIDQAPSVTADGLNLYLSSDRNASLGSYSLYVATRARASDPFGTPMFLPMVGTASIDSSPYVLPAGDVVYFTSLRTGSGDLYRATRDGSGFWEPTPVSVNSPLLEVGPVVTPDELTLYFASDRSGGSLGGFDVWMATRTDRTATFGPISNVQVVNSAGDDRPSFVSSDGCRLYLSRSVGASQYSVMVAERPR